MEIRYETLSVLHFKNKITGASEAAWSGEKVSVLNYIVAREAYCMQAPLFTPRLFQI